MATNPYQAAAGDINLYESLVRSKTMQDKMRGGLQIHKGKLTQEFEEELMKAEMDAQRALQEKSKKKKGLGALTSLLGFIPGVGPILSAAVGGISAATGAKESARKQRQMAERAKQFATSIDPRWQKSFLSGRAAEYKSKAENLYGDILRKAETAEDKAGSTLGMLATGVGEGLKQYATGKAIGKATDTFKAGKEIKGMSGVDKSLAKKGFELDPTFLSEKLGIDQKTLGKLLDAKSPGGRALFEGVKTGAKSFGDIGSLTGESEWLKGLIGMLAAGETSKNIQYY